MKITDLSREELALLGCILEHLTAFNLNLVKQPEKLKISTGPNLIFARVKEYCLTIGITLKEFTPKSAVDGVIYFQPWPTHEINRKHPSDDRTVDDLFKDYFSGHH